MDNQSPEIPKIEPSLMREDDDARGGGVLGGLLSKLGLGGGAAGAAGAGAVGGAGGILASKAGIVALVVAGSSMAAGIGMLTTGGGQTRRSAAGVDGEATLAFLPEAGSDSALATREAMRQAQVEASAASADGTSSSLGFFNEANQGAVADPTKAGGSAESADEWAEGETVDAAASGVKAPDHSNKASHTGSSKVPFNRPALAKKGGFGLSGGGGSSGATLVASANLPSGARGGAGGRGQIQAMRQGGGDMRGASSRGMAAASRGRNAIGQLGAHSGSLGSNLRSGHVSSQGSGTVMDGGRGAGSIGGASGGAIGAGGLGTGGGGLDSAKPTDNAALNTREVPGMKNGEIEGKNATPYQNELNMALIGIGVWVVGLVALGFVKKQMAAGGMTGAALAGLITTAKVITGIMALAGGFVAAMGMSIMGKDQMIGGLITAVGGFLAVDAAVRFAQLFNPVSDPPPGAEDKVAPEVAKTWTESNMGGLAGMMKGMF